MLWLECAYVKKTQPKIIGKSSPLRRLFSLIIIFKFKIGGKMFLKNREAEIVGGEITRIHPAASIDGRPVLVINGEAYGTLEVDFTILEATPEEADLLEEGGYPLRLIPETKPMNMNRRGKKTKTETDEVVDVWRWLRRAVDILDDPEEARDFAPYIHEVLNHEAGASLYKRITGGECDVRDRVIMTKWTLDAAARRWKGHQDLRDRLSQCRSKIRASISPEEAEKVAAEIRSLVADFGRRMASLLKTEGFLKHYETSLPG